MPVTYLLDQHRRAVLVDVRGHLTAADMVDAAGRIRREPFFHPGFALLVDLSEAGNLDVGAAAISDFVHAHDPFQPGVRRAIVATRPDSYGLARIYQSISNDLNIAIFRSRDEALSWLGLVPAGRA